MYGQCLGAKMKINFAAYGIRVSVYSRAVECFHCTQPEHSQGPHLEDIYNVALYCTSAPDGNEDRLSEVIGAADVALKAFAANVIAIRMMQ
jgi:hypothetical protein